MVAVLFITFEGIVKDIAIVYVDRALHRVPSGKVVWGEGKLSCTMVMGPAPWLEATSAQKGAFWQLH